MKAVVAGDNLSNIINKTSKSALEGVVDGFVIGRIITGTSQVISRGLRWRK